MKVIVPFENVVCEKRAETAKSCSLRFWGPAKSVKQATWTDFDRSCKIKKINLPPIPYLHLGARVNLTVMQPKLYRNNFLATEIKISQKALPWLDSQNIAKRSVSKHFPTW